MTELSESLTRMMNEFEKLPGVGKKSAERIAYHLLKIDKTEALSLADAIRAVKENVRYCKECYNLAEEELCEMCRNTNRNRTVLCIVEQPRDIILLEQTGKFDGLYHVLLGRLSPLEKITPEQLTIAALMKRLKSGAFTEIVMATNPTVEGDQTAYYIMQQLTALPDTAFVAGVKPNVTRLARGIVTGSDLQFANKEMLADALAERQAIK